MSEKMSAEEYLAQETFGRAHPKPVDIAQTEYEGRSRAAWDSAAAAFGYRLAGLRLGRAVFTTKQQK